MVLIPVSVVSGCSPCDSGHQRALWEMWFMVLVCFIAAPALI